MTSLDSFSLAAYAEWLARVARTHYVAAASSNPQAWGRPMVRLQHDVDISPAWCVPMAKAEVEEGLRATYCIQVGSPLYDVTRCSSALDEIYGLGHGIGLHYDQRRYDHSLLLGLEGDAEVLRAMGYNVRMVCAHKPLRNGHPEVSAEQLASIGLHSPQLKGEAYVSDSARGFTDEALALLDDPPALLRINFHPEHWTGRGREQIIPARLQEIADELDAEWRDWADIGSHPNALAQDARAAHRLTVWNGGSDG
jgi:hypothetical protein